MRFLLLTRKSGAKHSALVLLTGLLVAFVIVLALYLMGMDAVAALRDRSLSDLPEAGLISNFGILLMAAAVVAATTAAWRRKDAALAVLALFCCFFVLDDSLLFHESLGTWEAALFATYGLLSLLVLYLNSKAEGSLSWPIFLAIAAFVTSIAIDQVFFRVLELLLPREEQSFLRRVGFVIEDVPKFAGIVVLSSCAIGEAVLRRPKQERLDTVHSS